MEPLTSDFNKNNRESSFSTPTEGSMNNELERETWKGMAENLYHDFSRLWVKESQLIRTELNEKLTEIKMAAGSMAVGGAVLLVGLFAAVATAIIIVDLFTPLWLASLIVTGILLITGFVMVNTAKSKIEAKKLKPRHSIDALGEIKNSFQERIHEFNKH